MDRLDRRIPSAMVRRKKNVRSKSKLVGSLCGRLVAKEGQSFIDHRFSNLIDSLNKAPAAPVSMNSAPHNASGSTGFANHGNRRQHIVR